MDTALHIAVVSPRVIHNHFLFALICDADGGERRGPATWPNEWKHTMPDGQVVTYTHYPAGFPLHHIKRDKNTLVLMYTGQLTWRYSSIATSKRIQRFLAERSYFNMRTPGILEVNRVQPEELNQRDEDGRTPLLLACKLKTEQLALTFLKAKGVDVTIADNEGVTPLKAAIRMGHRQVVKRLREMGAT